MVHRQDTRAADALERQITAVSERLGETEHQLAHLATLENSISQLFQSLEQNRTAAREIAEDAAGRMADRLLRTHPQFTQAAAPAGPSAELVALEQGLEAVRASASAADQRNQETLQAVHETLEQIVNKIAELESANFAAPAQPAWHDAQGAPAWQERAPAASESYQQAQRPAADP